MTNCPMKNNDCSDDCQDDWIKCSICQEYLKASNEDGDVNVYRIYSAWEDCSDHEDLDHEMTICMNCFEKIRVLKELEAEKKFILSEFLLIKTKLDVFEGLLK